MTKEDKELLLRDLCARLPYRPIIHVEDYTNDEKLLDMYDWNLLDVVYFQDKLELSIKPNWDNYRTVKLGYRNYIIKPYLRPMSSMTEEEKEELLNLLFDKEFRNFYIDEEGFIDGKTSDLMKNGLNYPSFCPINIVLYMDWLNAHHFDYRGLIEKGLALETPEGMYKI